TRLRGPLAHLQVRSAPSHLEEGVETLIGEMDVLFRERPRTSPGGADLILGEPGAKADHGSGAVDVGVVEHADNVLVAELKLDLLEVPAGQSPAFRPAWLSHIGVSMVDTERSSDVNMLAATASLPPIMTMRARCC